jgi:hypothetical protein
MTVRNSLQLSLPEPADSGSFDFVRPVLCTERNYAQDDSRVVEPGIKVFRTNAAISGVTYAGG